MCSAIWFPNWKGHRDVFHRPSNIDRGIVLSGVGHAHCISQYNAITGQPMSDATGNVDGFITSVNRFVNRTEAARIAYDAGQVKELKDTIYSEDFLWSNVKSNANTESDTNYVIEDEVTDDVNVQIKSKINSFLNDVEALLTCHGKVLNIIVIQADPENRRRNLIMVQSHDFEGEHIA